MGELTQNEWEKINEIIAQLNDSKNITIIIVNTVKKHMNNIFGKLHVTTRVQIVHLLLEDNK